MDEAARYTTRACPECGATIDHDRLFVAWCSACDWNVSAGMAKARRGSWVDRARERISRRAGDSLFQEQLRRGPERPGFTRSRVGAIAICLLAIAWSVAALALGAWLLVGHHNVIAVLLGVVLVVTAVLTRPRFGDAPEQPLTREEAPTLYALADRIAASLHSRRVDIIGVDPRWNAVTYRAGIRQRLVIVIGLPLWHALDPAERVFVLGHELAHSVDSDVSRSMIVEAGFRSLVEWADMIRPSSLTNDDPGIVGLVMIPISLVLLAVSRGIEALTILLLVLLYRDSQRSEFYADRLAAGVSGTAASLGAMQGLRLWPAWRRTVHAMSTRAAALTASLDELDRQIALTPASELERFRRAERLIGASIDATHPPTFQREAVLAAGDPIAPAVTLSPADAQRIDAELAAYLPHLDKLAVEGYLERL